MSDESTAPSVLGEALVLLLAAANHTDAWWRIEGSHDWSTKPGRLTVWADLDPVTFDAVYDALNDDDDEISLPAASKESSTF